MDTPNQTAEPPPIVPNLDSLKRPFDAAKFRPAFDKKGRWKNLRGGRPKGPAARPAPSPAASAAPSSSAPSFADVHAAISATGPAAPASPVEMVAANPTAETIVGIIQTALVLIGEDEGVLSDTEKMLLTRPLARVLKKYDVGEDSLPCELEMAVAVAVVVISRLKKPKTATWFAKAKAWAVGAWFRRKGAAVASDVRREAAAVPDPSAA